MNKILCICTNRQGVENVLPIINNLKNEITCEVSFLDTDAIYFQNCNPLLSNYKIVRHNARIYKPLPLMNMGIKFFAIFYYLLKIRINVDYSTVILSGIGILEYYLVKKLKKENNTKIFLVQDAILTYPENKLFKKKLRKIFYLFKHQENICDGIFVSGDFTKRVKIENGIKEEKIFVFGIPRFRKLFIHVPQNHSNEKLKIIFLTGGYSWHGQHKMEKVEKHFLSKLDQLVYKFSKNITIDIKIHPRSDKKYYSEFRNMKSVFNFNNYEVIDNYDLILCTQIMSTLLFESLWLNKMCVFYKIEDMYVQSSKKLLYENLMIIQSIDELEKIFNDILINKKDPKLYGIDKDYFLNKSSFDSAITISKKIANILCMN